MLALGLAFGGIDSIEHSPGHGELPQNALDKILLANS